MISHENFALEGLYPGKVSTWSVANLGHFEIEVTIEQVGPPGSAAGTTRLRPPQEDKYRITIKVKHGHRVWEYASTVDRVRAEVVAQLMDIHVPEPQITVHSVSQQINPEPQITIEKRS